MSQNSAALEKVKVLSGMDDLILRPLSAKLLPPSRAEIEGWVDREQLLDIQGRSRAVQMELTEKYGLVEYPTPGGGCILTDPEYSDRLEIIEKDGLMDEEHSYLFHLKKKTRFYRLGERKYLFIGRDEVGNSRIEEYKDKGTLHVAGYKIGGPRVQMELTEKYGLVEYPTPGGGCLLTDPAYSDRLEIIEKDGLMDEEHSYLFHLIKKTRFYRLGERKYLFIGRDEEGNSRIEEYKEKGTLHVVGYKIGGPRILGYGDFTDEDKKFVVELFSRYSKVKGKSEIEVRLNNQVVKVAPVDIEEIERKIKEYQVVAQ